MVGRVYGWHFISGWFLYGGATQQLPVAAGPFLDSLNASHGAMPLDKYGANVEELR